MREVSNTARVSLGYLSEVERGRKEASSELLHAICGALDVPLSQVLVDAGAAMARHESPGSASSHGMPVSVPGRWSSRIRLRWPSRRPAPRSG